jgi:hypothetical protein
MLTKITVKIVVRSRSSSAVKRYKINENNLKIPGSLPSLGKNNPILAKVVTFLDIFRMITVKVMLKTHHRA